MSNEVPNPALKELLSSAVDDAASRGDWDALLGAMAGDAALRAAWSRSWQLRDARAGVAVCRGNCDFAAGVMRAIAEPAVAGPADGAAAESAGRSGKVVAFPARPRVVAETVQAAPALPQRARTRGWKTWLPVSAAAVGGLSAALIFGVARPPATDTAAPLADAGGGVTAFDQTRPSQVLAMRSAALQWLPAQEAPAPTAAVPADTPAAPDADAAAELDDYLVQHSGSLARSDVGGTLAGARFAVQAASYRTGE